MTHLEDAYKLIAGPVTEEKEINSIADNIDPKEVYKKFRSGYKLGQKEKNFLKEFLINKREKILSKANQQVTSIDKDLKLL
ncbi:hypothetical protein LEP1GSC158_0662 [Leptospira interrogans serovar Zanoni str. LT2156]|uniref:Uncharacterized protein n=1 Tax=Leptospira interrogans serovar Zanoni str. LT2156 TaxID=1001601 RepID=M6HAY4_LEPIR|nr:hypothetical protein LEP1GSC158_0662 [Leptospira interrogans serovar Zanoni str. LT2156]